MSSLLLVRHGQASLGAANYDNLSPAGRQQARWLGEHFAATGLTVQHLVSGGMQRHQQTIDEAGLAVPLPVPLIEPDFEEVRVGVILEAYIARHPEAAPSEVDARTIGPLLRKGLNAWAREEATGLESWTDFHARTKRGLDRLLDNDGTTVISTSGGVISVAIAQSLGLPPVQQIELFIRLMNTSVHHFVRAEDETGPRWQLHGMNAVPHLEAAERQAYRTYV